MPFRRARLRAADSHGRLNLMSYTIRVYPQHNSIGARRNRVAKRQLASQARFSRMQNLQLQRQLGAFVPGGNMYGRSVGQYSPAYSSYGYGAANCFPTQTAYNQGIGYGYGGLGSYGLYGSSMYTNPYQYAGYGYQPAYTGVSSLFGGLFNGLSSWL
jgi:hypothetical protein